MMSRLGLLVLTSCALLALPANPLRGQTGQQRVPATVALSSDEQLVPGAFVILRAAGGTPTDVIVLREDSASAVQLSRAVVMLLAARRTGGDTANVSHSLRGSVGDSRQRGMQREIGWTRRVLDDLMAAEERTVPGVGSTHAVTIYLPPRGGRR